MMAQGLKHIILPYHLLVFYSKLKWNRNLRNDHQCIGGNVKIAVETINTLRNYCSNFTVSHQLTYNMTSFWTQFSRRLWVKLHKNFRQYSLSDSFTKYFCDQVIFSMATFSSTWVLVFKKVLLLHLSLWPFWDVFLCHLSQLSPLHSLHSHFISITVTKSIFLTYPKSVLFWFTWIYADCVLNAFETTLQYSRSIYKGQNCSAVFIADVM